MGYVPALRSWGVVVGGSWVVISGVISRVTIAIRGLITVLITTHEPPSRVPFSVLRVPYFV